VLLTTDLAPGTSGTKYFLSQQGIVTVTPDGLMTAQSLGSVKVTIINGSAEVVVPVLVQAPQTGNVSVGDAGAVVQGSDGSYVAVPPGDVPSGTTVSIAPVTQADLPQALPDGFHYAGAFDLNLGVDGLNVPVQLGIKVDPSIAPGTKVYFFQAGDYLNNDGTTRPIWWQVENGVVGNDGYAHTSSKPFPGANANSRYLVAYGDSNLGTLQLQQALASQLAFTVALAGGSGGFMGAFGVASAAGIIATMAVPSAPQPEPFLLQILTQDKLPAGQTGSFQIDPGAINHYQTNVSVPPNLSSLTPQITNVSVAFPVDPNTNKPTPEVVLKGQFVLQGQTAQPNLTITFTSLANKVLYSKVVPAANEIHIAVPDTVTLGLAQITVSRPVTVFSNGKVSIGPQTATSNVARVDSSGNYVFVTLPEAQYTQYGVEGDLAVLNGDPSSPGTIGDLVARIPLEPYQPGTPVNFYANIPYPRDVAVTPDNTRAYVALLGTGRVAVVDAITLQEIDVSAERQLVKTPTDVIAAPGGVAVDPDLHSLVLTNSIDIRGTVSINNLGSWKLELVSSSQGTSSVLATGKTRVSSDVLLANFNPAQYASGFYRLRLTAFDPLGNSLASDDSVIFDLEANPTFKEIRMPFGAQPYGIAISPDGKFAYAAAHNPYLIGKTASS